MGQKVKPESIKVTVRLKDSPSESFTAICEPSLIGGWLHVETANTSVRIPESQIIRYSMAEITDSPLLSSDPDNGQYTGISAGMASYAARRLTEAAAETGQTAQLQKHLSVLLSIMSRESVDEESGEDKRDQHSKDIQLGSRLTEHRFVP